MHHNPKTYFSHSYSSLLCMALKFIVEQVKKLYDSFVAYVGVKATYLLAVAFLEIIRFSSNGGILNVHPNSTASRSSFSCVFEYLKSPNLVPAVSQCLTAIVHRAFETALSWLVFISFKLL